MSFFLKGKVFYFLVHHCPFPNDVHHLSQPEPVERCRRVHNLKIFKTM